MYWYVPYTSTSGCPSVTYRTSTFSTAVSTAVFDKLDFIQLDLRVSTRARKYECLRGGTVAELRIRTCTRTGTGIL